MRPRADETIMLIAIQQKDATATVRDVTAQIGIPPKRAYYLLDKWSRKGWYEWGVVVDLGWLTEAGRVAT